MVRFQVLVGLVSLVAWLAGSGTSQAQSIPSQGVYQVTISGTVSGWAFNRTGYLSISPTIDTRNSSGTGVNPREVRLVSGNPMANPQRGAIVYATNVQLVGAGTALDIAQVALTSSTRKITVANSPNLSYGSRAVYFNASTGLAANAWFIREGGMQLQFSSNGQAVIGTIAFQGVGSTFGTSTYVAKFVGVKVQ